MKTVGGKRHVVRFLILVGAAIVMFLAGFGIWMYTQSYQGKLQTASVGLNGAEGSSGFDVSLSGSLSMDRIGASYSDCYLDVKTTVGTLKSLLKEISADPVKSVSMEFDITCSFNNEALNDYIYCLKIGTCENKTPNSLSSVFSASWTESDTSGEGMKATYVLDAHFPVIFEWKDNKKPTTAEETNTMNERLKQMASDAVTFNVTFNADSEKSFVTYY